MNTSASKKLKHQLNLTSFQIRNSIQRLKVQNALLLRNQEFPLLTMFNQTAGGTGHVMSADATTREMKQR
jgi:hypothetical protein